MTSKRRGRIACKLHIVSLADGSVPPPFTALSYVWGAPDFTVAIHVNGERFLVTPNLYEALKSIQTHWSEVFPDRNATSFWLWVCKIVSCFASAVCFEYGATLSDFS